MSGTIRTVVEWRGEIVYEGERWVERADELPDAFREIPHDALDLMAVQAVLAADARVRAREAAC